MLKKYEIGLECKSCNRSGKTIITYKEMSFIKVGCKYCRDYINVYLSKYKGFKSSSSLLSISACATQIGDP